MKEKVQIIYKTNSWTYVFIHLPGFISCLNCSEYFTTLNLKFYLMPLTFLLYIRIIVIFKLLVHT